MTGVKVTPRGYVAFCRVCAYEGTPKKAEHGATAALKQHVCGNQHRANTRRAALRRP